MVTETLTDVVTGVVVVIDGMSEMVTDFKMLTLTLGTVATVTVVVGAGSDRHSQAVEMRLQAKGTGAPAQPPAG